MKLTILFLIAAMVQVHATGLSQTVTYTANNVRLETVFKHVERQTGFTFFYHEDVLKDAKPVSIAADNLSLSSFLDVLFTGQRLSYSIKGKNVIVRKKVPGAKLESVENILTMPEIPPLTIRGQVVNEKGEPVIASVVIKGTKKGVTTDSYGNFEIDNVDDNATLIISGVNIETQEVKVKGREQLIISITTSINEEEEVIVKTNYWETKQKLNPGNISKVTAKDIEKQPTYNPLQSVQGRVAGVSIKQASGIPGGGFSVEIRGQNSVRPDGDDPLYVIDGVPFPAQSLSKQGAGGIFTSPLNSINPSDIESIQILKDADATAIYGSLGANGVINITTKKGKAGKAQVGVDIYSGVGQVTRKMQLLNTSQYLEMRREAYKNDGADIAGYGARDLLQWDTTRYTDWQKELLGGTAHNLNAQLSLSGGNENFRFFLSGGFFRETAVLPGDFNFKKGSLHFGLSHTSSNKKFNVDFSSIYAGTNSALPSIDLTSSALNLPPIAPSVYTEQGELNWQNSTWVNPVSYTLIDADNQGNNMVNNINLSYMLLPGLQIKTICGYNRIELEEFTRIPLKSQNPMLFPVSRSTLNNNNIVTWNVEPQIVYTTPIGKSLKFESLIGGTFRQSTTTLLAIEATGFSNDAFIDNLSAAAKVVINNDGKIQYKYNALFGRLNFNWLDKYIVNLTGRRDGSGRFGANHQFANFGAAGVAWVFSKEGFVQDNLGTWLSFGKLRGSVGTAGNDQIGDYQYLDAFASSPLKYLGISIFRPSRLANPDYRWEKTTKREIGLELGLFADKIFTSVSYYNNRSSNQLVSYIMPATTGFSSITENLPAIVQNTGIEIQVQTLNFSSKKIKWSTSLNLTIPRNKLIAFPNLEGSSYATNYLVGEPLTISQLYKNAGVDPQTGLYQYNDYDKDGEITTPADRKIIINRGSGLYGGLQNTISYAGFQLDFLFQFVKQKAGNYLSYSAFEMPGTISNQPVEVIDRWQSPGDIAHIQKYSRSSTANAEYIRSRSSDLAYTDASFIRLRNVSLSYQLPLRVLDRMKMQAASIYMQAQNLATFTRYKGLDPENFGNALPPLRVVTFGLRVSL